MRTAKDFSYEKSVKGDEVFIAAREAIDERFDIPLKDLVGAHSAQLDFSGINWINSLGIRKFSKWLWEIEDKMPDLKVSFTKLPPVVVRQFNLIRTQFGKNVDVKSVYVPFYCDACDVDDKSVLVTRQDVSGNGPMESKVQSHPCPKCGKPMQMDVVDNYFAIMR